MMRIVIQAFILTVFMFSDLFSVTLLFKQIHHEPDSVFHIVEENAGLLDTLSHFLEDVGRAQVEREYDVSAQLL